MRHFLDFEKPVAELESKIEELRRMSEPDGINIAEEVARLTEKADRQLRATYAKLTPWQKTQVARHPERPKALDYIAGLITDFTPLAGDRAFADDAAVVGGMGRFHGRSVVVLGTEKGTDTESRVKHNFGMARPEGYRKARRLIELAGRFGLPVLTFVRHLGRLPGHRGRGARPGGGHRPLDRGVPRSAGAAGRHHHRRRRLGRRHRAGRRRPGADAGARDLLGDLARGLRVDPVARRGPGAGRGRGAAADRRGPHAAARWSTRSSPSRSAARIGRRDAAVHAVGAAVQAALSPLLALDGADAEGAAAGEVPRHGPREPGLTGRFPP